MLARRTNGFTLIELMIVVAIVAILAAIALPSYSRYGFRSRRTEGQSYLAQIAAAEERYFTAFNKYTSDVTSASPTGLGFASNASERGYYTVAVSGLGGTNTAYTLTATPAGQQVGDTCENLILDNLGNKTISSGGNTKNGACW